MRCIAALRLLCATLALTATARAESACGAEAAPKPPLRDYAPTLRACRAESGAARLAIRAMSAADESWLLLVDPETLATRLAPARCWRCAQTSDAAQAETRYLRALAPPQDGHPETLVNAGLIHGPGAGAFVTGDLCPSSKPLDRGFFEKLAALGPGTPVTLAVSGAWIAHHGADFAWLREKQRNGALAIDWANHSYSHPYLVGLKDAQNYLLRPGVDLDREIFETEKLLIANGATPSVFFRFPGLVADESLLERLRARHLIALGADAWLALGPAPRPGSIVLVHPNGNEPVGLKIFSRLLESGKIPRPLRPITEAPPPSAQKPLD